MPSDHFTFVVDTNIIVDYVEIIPNGTKNEPEEQTIDLSHAHIVIPTAVIRELSNFKNEQATERGKASREALRRIRKLTEGKIKSLDEVYNLDAPIEAKNGKQLFSILPVHDRFKNVYRFIHLIAIWMAKLYLQL